MMVPDEPPFQPPQPMRMNTIVEEVDGEDYRKTLDTPQNDGIEHDTL